MGAVYRTDNSSRLKDSVISTKKFIRKNWDLYILILPVFAYFIIFKYVPIYGVQIAFKNYLPSKGFFGSPWIGFDHFQRFFNSFDFWNVLKNTLGLSLYSLAVGFPIPIILALLLNEVKNKTFKKTVQTVTYAPHFISTVVLVGMITAFLSPSNGLVNKLIVAMGGQSIYFMTEPVWFKSLYVLSGVWQSAGWGSIIYMAAIAGIDVELYEAAIVDGATKLKRLWYITIPCIMPTAIILLILQVGNIMNVGFEKVFLMQNELNRSSSDVISTYVYRVGLIQSDFSFSSAVDMFNSVINFTLLVTVNRLTKKLKDTSLW